MTKFKVFAEPTADDLELKMNEWAAGLPTKAKIVGTQLEMDTREARTNEKKTENGNYRREGYYSHLFVALVRYELP